MKPSDPRLVLRLVAWVALASACAHAPPAPVPAVAPQAELVRPSAPPAPPADGDALAAVAFVHGGAGPWAVAGYRMGRAALARLGLTRQSFDLDVIHHTPEAVQYSCIADGAAAATGASVGKLNLHVAPASEREVSTTYTNRSTQVSVTLRPAPAFVARFKDVPRERLGEAGREVLALPDAAIFEEVSPL
jgi:hypothetical protein